MVAHIAIRSSSLNGMPAATIGSSDVRCRQARRSNGLKMHRVTVTEKVQMWYASPANTEVDATVAPLTDVEAFDDVETLDTVGGIGGFGGGVRGKRLRLGAAAPELRRSRTATRQNTARIGGLCAPTMETAAEPIVCDRSFGRGRRGIR